MPDYSSLSTQITAVKQEITDSLGASTYSAQDLVFVAKALETLGTLLGVSDIVAATAAQVTSVTSAGTTATTAITTAQSTATTAITNAQTTAVAAVNTTATNLTVLAYMGVLA